jgi:predicted aspartyl protease
VSVNGGRPLWFIVDTGAEFSILSDTLAKRLDLRTRRRGIRDFASGVTLTFGGVELPRRDVMIMSFETFRARKRPIEGIIGHDFFERYVVTIDYAGKTLTAIEPGNFRAPDGAESIPLRFAGNLAVVPVTLELAGGKRTTANVIVDTGASQALVLRHPFAQKHDLLRQSKSSSTAGSLESVSVSFAHVPAKRLSLGRWSFDNPPIRAYRTATGAGGYTATDGALGNEILRRFRVTLDYPRKRMLLQPN